MIICLNCVTEGFVSTKLQYVEIPIINNTECQTIYKKINKLIDKDLMCAGYSIGLKDSCEVSIQLPFFFVESNACILNRSKICAWKDIDKNLWKFWHYDVNYWKDVPISTLQGFAAIIKSLLFFISIYSNWTLIYQNTRSLKRNLAIVINLEKNDRFF